MSKMEYKNVSFVEFEKKRLFDLIDRDREIIESRRTDASTVYKKQKAWERIARDYNRYPGVRIRLPQQLKRLWQNENARAKVAKSNTNSNINSNTNSNAPADREEVRCRQSVSEERENDDGRNLNAQPSSPINDIDFECLPNEIPGEFEEIVEDPIEMQENLPQEVVMEIDRLVQPLLVAKATRIDQGKREQAELHQVRMKQEELKVKAAEEDIKRQDEEHALQMKNERELGDLRVAMDKELYQQRLRQDREMHQLRMDEYKKKLPAVYQDGIYKQSSESDLI